MYKETYNICMLRVIGYAIVWEWMVLFTFTVHGRAPCFDITLDHSMIRRGGWQIASWYNFVMIIRVRMTTMTNTYK